MRDLRLPTALAGIVAVYGLATTPTAQAATAYGSTTVPGGACQLSIPTTNTGVRPKATGFRNESTTTSNFVYCPIPLTSYSQAEQPYGIGIIVYSIDGAPHNVTCTLVAGLAGSSVPTVYSSKAETVDASDNVHGAYPGQLYAWDATDFGGTYGDFIPGGFLSSVTCNLAPQTAITFVQAGFEYQAGT
jgi:hypothetical protein